MNEASSLKFPNTESVREQGKGNALCELLVLRKIRKFLHHYAVSKAVKLQTAII